MVASVFRNNSMMATSNRFSAADHLRVTQAIQQAESTTSAEIIAVVAGSSGRYDRSEDMVGLWFAAAAVVAAWIAYPLPSNDPGSWQTTPPAWQLVALLTAGIVGFVVGVLAASRVGWLRRLFAPRSQMSDEVYRSARQVFFDKRVHHTDGSTGVLLYVSLFERMAAVIADQRVLEALGQSRIDEICRELTTRLHSGDAIDALCETSRSTGRYLALVLPSAAGDVNELEDALVVID
jgi:putative membrane protein